MTITLHLNNTYATTLLIAQSKLPQTPSKIFYIPAPSEQKATEANLRYKVETEKKIAAEKARKEREDKINRVVAFLQKQNSPVANYEIASIIVDESAANGADFRVVVAISGIESGFCNASFWYNCFGYLNGVKYSSYLSAFKDIVPKVARQYAAPYGWNFEALAKAYGMINWQYHSANLYYYASSI